MILGEGDRKVVAREGIDWSCGRDTRIGGFAVARQTCNLVVQGRSVDLVADILHGADPVCCPLERTSNASQCGLHIFGRTAGGNVSRSMPEVKAAAEEIPSE